MPEPVLAESDTIFLVVSGVLGCPCWEDASGAFNNYTGFNGCFALSKTGSNLWTARVVGIICDKVYSDAECTELIEALKGDLLVSVSSADDVLNISLKVDSPIAPQPVFKGICTASTPALNAYSSCPKPPYLNVAYGGAATVCW
jgi:hypothetical protein